MDAISINYGILYCEIYDSTAKRVTQRLKLDRHSPIFPIWGINPTKIRNLCPWSVYISLRLYLEIFWFLIGFASPLLLSSQAFIPWMNAKWFWFNSTIPHVRAVVRFFMLISKICLKQIFCFRKLLQAYFADWNRELRTKFIKEVRI